MKIALPMTALLRGADALRVVVAALSVFSMGGVVFGLAALYPVLYAEGVFADLCGEAACGGGGGGRGGGGGGGGGRGGGWR